MQEPSASIDNPALIEQLSQLNQRVRLYASQIWQVPFAYLGLVLLSFAGWDSLSDWIKATIMIGMGIVGILVLIHHSGLIQANNDTVDRIEEVENALGLTVTVRKRCSIVCPLVALVILTFAMEVIGGIVYLCWILSSSSAPSSPMIGG